MAKYSAMQKELAYRIYITDSLYYHAENKRISKRFYDVINPPAEDNRSGDEIALDVINKLGLKVD